MHRLSASDLVQRTLFQDGLLPGLGAMDDGSTRPSRAPLQDRPVPHGAEFRHETHSCAAGTRSYRSYIPAAPNGTWAGVIVMLHGCAQNPEDFAIGNGMNALADTHGLILIYPEQSRGNNAQSCWNWFSRGDQQRDKGEPAILAGITRKVMAEHGIEPDQTFVVGLSAGAAMAVILGETYPDVFSAVGVHSGLAYGAANGVPSAFAAMAGNALQEPGNAEPNRATRTIVFHGTADSIVYPSNGDQVAQQAVARGPRQTVQADSRGVVSGCAYMSHPGR
jgi:poly(hydroxyalkanoate) depolymerase family esterase